jgi:hypothetical protein
MRRCVRIRRNPPCVTATRLPLPDSVREPAGGGFGTPDEFVVNSDGESHGPLEVADAVPRLDRPSARQPRRRLEKDFSEEWLDVDFARRRQFSRRLDRAAQVARHEVVGGGGQSANVGRRSVVIANARDVIGSFVAGNATRRKPPAVVTKRRRAVTDEDDSGRHRHVGEGIRDYGY